MQLPHVPHPRVNLPRVQVPHISLPHWSSHPSSEKTLEEAIVELASTDQLLVALDFDGTLAPFVDTPQAARAIPAAQAAVEHLEVLPNTWVAYISGRSLTSLMTVTKADDDALLVGSHGVEIKFGSDGEQLGITTDEADRLARLGNALEDIVTKNPDVRLERKPMGFSVHTRRLSGDDAAAVNAEAYDAAHAVSSELTVRDGKGILEFSVRTANKGDGLARLREHVEATAVFFAGDDITDEDGFAVLRSGDVGVKVGHGETAADFRVADPEAIAKLLEYLAAARASRFS